LAAKSNIPWNEWVKLYTKCHHCSAKGHICPHCPDYLKKIKSGEIKRPFCPHKSQLRPTNHGVPQACCQNFANNQKMKAFLTAFTALFEGSVKTDSTEGDDDASQSDGDEHAKEELDNDIYNFLAKVGSLKE
jgi:hypothetical protein